MKKCKICGKNSYSDYCFKHKPKKRLITNKKKESSEDGSQMRTFFLSIWKKRLPHNCVNCGKSLGHEPRIYMFDHILEKQNKNFKHLIYEEDNIQYLCLHCHDEKTRHILSPYMQRKIQETLKRFNLV